MVPEALMREVKRTEVTRVAIDSITPFEYLTESQKEFRIKLLTLIDLLSKENVTLLATAERRRTDFEMIEFIPEDFLFDGLILMGRLRKAVSFERVLSIVKMRGTGHSELLHPVKISDRGLIVETTRE